MVSRLQNVTDATTLSFFRLTLAVCATVIFSAIASSASAGLIGTTYDLRLDGHVKQGATLAVETYTASPVFNVLSTVVNGVVNPGSAVPPLDPAEVLSVLESDAAGVVTIWLSNQGQPLFANPLDPAFLVQFEATLYWDDLGPNEKIVPSDFKLENFNFYPAVTSSFSGKGTVADPLRVVYGFNPDHVGGPGGVNIMKVLFDYDRVTNVVPEPASCGLMTLAAVGLCGVAGRRNG